ncbi:MAG: universal stress protein [Candidatus Nanopelagicales bacterium]
MEIIIGVNPDSLDNDAFALGSNLARMLKADVLLAHIYPTSFDYPSAGHVDVEWRAFIEREAEQLLAESKERFCRVWGWDPGEVKTVIAGNRSSGKGLVQVAEERGSALIVIGAAPNAASGRFVIGSTADKLLHSAGVPVAVAPAGYARTRHSDIGKLVVCFQNTPESRRTLATAAGYSAATGVPLQVLTILLRHRVYASNLGADAEGPVLASLSEDAATAVAEVLTDAGATPGVETVTITADSVQAAIERTEWEGDELLVIGSAVSGPVRRVFLGDMTYKLLRSTPVPAVVLPRHG